MTTLHIPHLRIFISSPGDVYEERNIAEDVIRKISQEEEFFKRVILEPIRWEKMSPGIWVSPQRAVNLELPMPTTCDIFVLILWNRMGTPLPVEGSGYNKNEQSFLSGTQYELFDAIEGTIKNSNHRPYILPFRRIKRPLILFDNEKTLQLQHVDKFWAEIRSTRICYTYTERQDFRKQLYDLLTRRVRALLEEPNLADDLKTDRYLESIDPVKYSNESIKLFISDTGNESVLRIRAIRLAIKFNILTADLITRILSDYSNDVRHRFTEMAMDLNIPLNEQQIQTVLDEDFLRIRKQFIEYIAANGIPVSEIQLKQILEEERSIAKCGIEAAYTLVKKGLFTSSILRYASGTKQHWEVHRDAIRRIIDIDDAESVTTISAFSSATYHITRKNVCSYFRKLYEENRLKDDQRQIACKLLQYWDAHSSKSDQSVDSIKKTLELLKCQ